MVVLVLIQVEHIKLSKAIPEQLSQRIHRVINPLFPLQETTIVWLPL